MTVANWVARISLLFSGTNSSIDVDPQDISRNFNRVPDRYENERRGRGIARDILGHGS